MNNDAKAIIQQLDARRELLVSLTPSGNYVLQNPETGLCFGHVADGTPAMVPVEFAKVFPQTVLNAARNRSVVFGVQGTELVPMVTAVADAMQLISTERAWVEECGSGRTQYPRDAIDAG